jgi:hypothetical protein
MFENRLLRQIKGGVRCGKLFISRPCKKRAKDLFELSGHQLRMVAAFLMGHAPVRKHLQIVGLFDGDPTDFAG